MNRLDIITLPTEIDNPRIAVPRNNPKPPSNKRNIIPNVRKISNQKAPILNKGTLKDKLSSMMECFPSIRTSDAVKYT
ncbi:hypothetical protein I6U48_28545 [Clostridium sp. PL3]|uniref:Uncharacterized protein n=1 Tax=Clostridium thailandense TaxID=2794346 RepID=A0A949U5H0_9CLOT|nr:hypothetical protein [Clostridium thailandense]